MQTPLNDLSELLAKNRAWAEAKKKGDPQFFSRLAAQQSPQILWIGCSDSRVPATEIVGLEPGEIFVHRNIANLAVHTDLNLLSVLHYGIEILRVRHVVVCGHYGCGGIEAVLAGRNCGLADNWLRHVDDVYRVHADKFAPSMYPADRENLLCELNVLEQVRNVCNTPLAQGVWREGRRLSVHGWVYGVADGLIRDLGIGVSGPDQVRGIEGRMKHASA
jgi:carbonic anhydrase